MAVESATYLNDLDETAPGGEDFKYEGDNHIRLLKDVLKTTFFNVTGQVLANQTEMNLLVGWTVRGSAASRDAGSAEGNVCLIGALNGSPSLPAVDGSRLTGVATTDRLIADVQLQQLKDGFFVAYALSFM